MKHFCYLYGELENTPTTFLPSSFEWCILLLSDDCHLGANLWTKDELFPQMAVACWQTTGIVPIRTISAMMKLRKKSVPTNSDDSGIRWGDTMLLGQWVPTFRWNAWLSSSRVKRPVDSEETLILEDESTVFLRNSGIHLHTDTAWHPVRPKSPIIN